MNPMKSLRNQAPNILLLLLYPAFLLPNIPVAIDLKVYLGLISLFVIPGYILVNLIARERLSNLGFLERTVIYLGGSLSLMLIPWLLVYFAGLSITVAFWGICALGVLGLISLALVKRPSSDLAGVGGAFAVSWDSLIISLFIVACMLGTYAFGAKIEGDETSFRAYMRNIYHGEIAPEENVQAEWERDYRGIAYRHPLLLLSYAATAKAIAVDPDAVWVRAPSFFTFFFLAVNYGLAKFIFKKRRIAYLALVLSPIVLASSLGPPALVLPSLVGPHLLSNSVFLPSAILFALWYMLDDDPHPLFLLLPALLAVVLTVEHTQHFFFFLLALGSFGVVRLILERRLTTDVWKNGQIILLSILLSLPYLLAMRLWASQVQHDSARLAAAVLASGRRRFFGIPNFYIVHPYRLLRTNPGLIPWILIGVLFYRKRFYRTAGGSFLLSNLAVVTFIGLNPILAPLVSHLVEPRVVFRLGDLMPVLPIASFCLYRAWVTLARSCKRDRIDFGGLLQKGKNRCALILILLALPAFGSQVSLMSFNTIEWRIRQSFFSPKGASPNWLDNRLRAAVESRLVENPFYLFVEPPRIALFLDRSILEFIEDEIEDNSVFLSEHVVEAMLPAYANQLAFLGRYAAPGLDFDPAHDTSTRPPVRERRAAAYTILSPETSVSQVEALLEQYRDEIDYVLVTPKKAFLRSKLDEIDFTKKIYDQNGLALYEIR